MPLSTKGSFIHSITRFHFLILSIIMSRFQSTVLRRNSFLRSNSIPFRSIQAMPSLFIPLSLRPTNHHITTRLYSSTPDLQSQEYFNYYDESLFSPSKSTTSSSGEDINFDSDILFGSYKTMTSERVTSRKFVDISTIGTQDGPKDGDIVWIRGRINSLRAKGNACFLVIRSTGSSCISTSIPFMSTLQACHFKNKSNPELSKNLIKFTANNIPLESIVDIMGIIKTADVKSCTQNNVELHFTKIIIVSLADRNLPFSIEDASRSQSEIDASTSVARPFSNVPQDMRLNNRWLDLRVPANNAIMRVRSGVMRLFRESLYTQGFMEISSPKIIPGESEGGSEVFRLDYFGQSACLAQSPQLYKQMAMSADLGRVFEVGPVFRAENSHTRRHLCEFTGLDIEMPIQEHYNEVLAVLHNMFRHIFEGLEVQYAAELKAIRLQYPSEPLTFTHEPLVLHWHEAMKLLKENTETADIDETADLSGFAELKLGEIVKEKYSTDFFMLDQYPASVRPFYTMPTVIDDGIGAGSSTVSSNSYDLFIRGQEICSGAQRCHDADLLEQRLVAKGVDPAPLASYVQSFRHGMPPHAGAGIGLERVVFLYLGLDNVRKASMFPRDPNRCSP